MSRLWMPLYVGDLLGATMDCDDRRFGIYMRLIIHCWQHGRIPADPEKLRIICHSSTKSWKKHCNILDFFQRMEDQQGSYYVHPRVTQERIKFEEISNKRRAAALQKHTHTHTHLKPLTSSFTEPRARPVDSQ